MTKLQETLDYLKQHIGSVAPTIGIVLGSGLNNLGQLLQNPISLSYCDIPGFTDCSVRGHQGKLLFGTLAGKNVVCLQGRVHYYEGNTHSAMQTPIRTLKLLGCEALILTNAAASLREEVPPGSLVIINDHINFQFQNPLVGSNDDYFGPRFPSMQQAYDAELITLATQVAQEINLKITTGVYLAALGPCFETPAEIRAFKILGADIVGMSTVPEVIIARHCNMRVLAISTITNMGCGMSDEWLLHETVLQVAKTASVEMSQLLINVISKLQCKA